MTTFQLLFSGVLGTTCLYAIIKGAMPERIVAVSFIVGAVASRYVELSKTTAFRGLEVGILHVDLAMLAIFVGLALFSSRFWPMAMASLQGTQVVGHFARVLDHGTLPKAYFALAVLWSFPMLLLLVLGTWRHRRRQKRYGRDYSWSWELPQTYRDGAECGESEQV